jgi:MYXO-CTERM domain-containing protein
LAAVLAAALASGPASARAFETKHTEAGTPVRWHERSVPLLVGSPACGPSREELLAALEIATDAWRGIGSSPDVVVRPGAPARGIGYDARGPNDCAVYVLCDDWPYGEAHAVTVETHDAVSGALLDADLVIDGGAPLAVLAETDGARGERRYDLPSVLTHEIGHFLGLGESEVRTATMWPRTSRGDTSQRTLEVDDEEGILALYGAPPAAPSSSCSVSAGGTGRGKTPAAVLLLSTVALLRRRRRAQTSSEDSAPASAETSGGADET